MDIYDRAGKRIDLAIWLRLHTNPAYVRVAFDKVNGVEISTAWLGMNHAFQPGPILIFETMVFDGPLDGKTLHYSTEADAIAGHAVMLARVYASQASTNIVKARGSDVQN